MSNPNYIPSPLNRLIASIIWTDFTTLNITPEQLLTEGVNLSFDGNFNTNLPALTSVVPSPEPYVPVSLMVHIIRTSPLAALYKSQMETITYLGTCTLRADTANLPAYTLQDMSITKLSAMSFNGHDAGFVVGFAGTYSVNNSLWP